MFEGGEQTLPSAKRCENRKTQVGPGSIGLSASGIWRSSRVGSQSTESKEKKGFTVRPFKADQASKHAGPLGTLHAAHVGRGGGGRELGSLSLET